MSKLLIHLLESSVLIAVFYGIYYLVLRKESFFQLTRWYLLASVLLSLGLPYFQYDFLHQGSQVKTLTQVNTLRQDYYAIFDQTFYDTVGAVPDSVEDRAVAEPPQTRIDLSQLICGAYLLVLTLLILRFSWLFVGIRRLALSSTKELRNGLVVFRTSKIEVPFSFWKYVFLPKQFEEGEDLDQVLAHEDIHIRQRHSVDLIFVQLAASILWFNPVIWWLHQSLKSIHEYIADRKILNSGYSLVTYQTLLLKQVVSHHSNGLVHNFNLSFIKKRIAMMDIKSGKSGMLKAAVAIVVTIATSLIIVQCNARFDEQNLEVSESTTVAFEPAVRPEGHALGEIEGMDRLDLTIAANKLTVNGNIISVAELENQVNLAQLSRNSVIVMNIDKNQKMGFVKEVQNELRKLDKRRLLYGSESASGDFQGMAMLLPPLPEDWEKIHSSPMPDLDKLAAEGGIEVLRLVLGTEVSSSYQSQVYDFVTENLEKELRYVVSAKAKDDITYQTYLEGLSFINEGFNQYYQEKADELYGDVNFSQLNIKIPEEKAKYDAIRAGAPRSISIAED